MKRLLCLLLIPASIGCNQATPNDNALVPSSNQASSSQNNNQADPYLEEALRQEFDHEDDRREVRRVAAEYMSARHADWRVEGMATFAYAGTLYMVSVDATAHERRQTFELVARMFMRESGEFYWRVERLTPELERALTIRTARPRGN